MEATIITQLQPLLVDDDAAGKLLGIGRSLLLQLDESGQLGPMPIRLGRRRLWRVDELTAWVKNGMPRREIWVDRKGDL